MREWSFRWRRARRERVSWLHARYRASLMLRSLSGYALCIADSAHTWIHCQKMLKGVNFNWTCRGPSLKPSPKVRFHSLWPCQLRSDQPWSSSQLGWHTRVLARPVMVLTARLSLVDFALSVGSCYTIGNFGGNLSFGCLPFFGLSATYFQF